MAREFVCVLRRHLPLGAMLAIAVVTSPRSDAGGVDPRELRGACYCRARSELMCEANVTARECDARSKQALCDDWFWKERLACWNWGYGG